jgi:hypothetical protein
MLDRPVPHALRAPAGDAVAIRPGTFPPQIPPSACSMRRSRAGLDVRPGVYHTFVVLEPDTVVFEAKLMG